MGTRVHYVPNTLLGAVGHAVGVESMQTMFARNAQFTACKRQVGTENDEQKHWGPLP